MSKASILSASLAVLVSHAGALLVSPASPRSASLPLSNNLTQERSMGAERCLDSESPVWCLAEEVTAGISKAFYPEAAAEGKATSTDTFSIISDLAATTFDIDLSPSSQPQDAESRSRRRRKYAFLLVAFGTILAIILPLKLKAIALMAATALFVGKLALVIASLVGLRKLVHKPSDETTHVHYSGHRSDPDAHFLAYGEHVPQYSPVENY